MLCKQIQYNNVTQSNSVMAHVVKTTTLGNNLFTLINITNKIKFVYRLIKSTQHKKIIITKKKINKNEKKENQIKNKSSQQQTNNINKRDDSNEYIK